MPFRRRFRRPIRRPVYRNNGAPGYVGAKVGYKTRRNRRKGGFVKKVERIVSNKLLEKANLQITTQKRIANTAAGTQAYAVVLVQNSKADLNSIFSHIGTPVAGGQPASTLPSQKFTVTSYCAQIMCKNQSNVSVMVDLFELFPRRDTQSLPDTVFLNSFIDQGSTGQDTVWGASPFQANAFCTMFKINKKSTYMLTPGATEIIDFRDSKDYVIEYERIAQNNLGANPIIGYKGLTRYFFAIVRGEPVNDSTTKTNVSTSLYAVDFIMNECYYYTFLPQNVVQSAISNSFSAVAAQNSVLIDTGATVTPAQS